MQITEEFEILNEQKRRQKVINFITNNHGCIAEDVVRGMEAAGRFKIGRVKVFRILIDLKNENMVFEELSDKNRKNKKLFVNNSNLLVSLPRELETFEKAYFSLIDRLKKEFESRKDTNEYFSRGKKFNVFMNILSIFEHIIKSYLMNATYLWPNTISDTDSLSKLYTMLFAQLSQIYLRLANTNRSVLREYDAVEFMLINNTCKIRPEYKKSLLNSCKEYGLAKEIEPVLHIAERISSRVAHGVFESCGSKISVGGDENKATASVRIDGVLNNKASGQVAVKRKKPNKHS